MIVDMKSDVKDKNFTFVTLSAIGIILILLGHLDYDILTFNGIFPYYSYHVMIFVFISGYFYKQEDEDAPGGFIIRKLKKLLIPYLLYNLAYGLLTSFLLHTGFCFGEKISLYNLFIAPFIGGHQFGLNAPGWFIPALFLLEICDMIARLIGNRISKILKTEINEWLWMILYLLIGVLVVFLAKRGSVYDLYKLPGRLMLMAPSFELGRLYKKKLEKHDFLPSVIYFPVLFIVNIILITLHGGLAYSTVWVTGFGGSVVTPFVTAFTGIALWLRIAKIIAKRIGQDGMSRRCIEAIGENTFHICLNHLFVFFLINEIYVTINRISCLFPDLDRSMLHNDIYYTYCPSLNDGFKLIYLIVGIALPSVIACLIKKRCKIR